MKRFFKIFNLQMIYMYTVVLTRTGSFVSIRGQGHFLTQSSYFDSLKHLPKSHWINCKYISDDVEAGREEWKLNQNV